MRSCGLQILRVPDDLAYNGRGPLVSARLLDLDRLWTRAYQALPPPPPQNAPS